MAQALLRAEVIMRTRSALLALSIAASTLAGCDAPANPMTNIEFQDGVEGLGKADHNSLEITPVNAAIDHEVLFAGGQFIITSAESWEEHMQTEPPADVDFSREWVAFFGAGSRSTGGYAAEILAVDSLPQWRGLLLTTRTQSPGFDCLVTQAFTNPHSVVKFDIPAVRPTWAAADHSDEVVNCGPDNEERLAELAVSLEAWEEAKADARNTYNYSRESFSFFANFGTETDFVVEEGVVVERHYKAQSGNGGEAIQFSEIGDEVGNDPRGHRVATIDDLYEECRTEVLTQDADENFINLSFDDAGLLRTCTYFPRFCADDCTFGVTISTIEL